MSDESRPNEGHNNSRELTISEREVVEFLLNSSTSGVRGDGECLSIPKAVELTDGVMGSLLFCSDKYGRKYNSTVSRAEFIDGDGILVSICLSLDQYGDLFELDVWKVDFSPLIRWPKTTELHIMDNSNG